MIYKKDILALKENQHHVCPDRSVFVCIDEMGAYRRFHLFPTGGDIYVDVVYSAHSNWWVIAWWRPARVQWESNDLMKSFQKTNPYLRLAYGGTPDLLYGIYRYKSAGALVEGALRHL